MKTMPVAAVLAGITAAAAPSAADDGDRARCFEAAEQGQALRQAHQLVEARDQLRQCVAPACPATMQSDCASWLGEVERAIPTVVLSAKDVAGEDVLDVSVLVDGRPLASRLDGTALPVNPGAHTFAFRWPDGSSVERQLLVAEGQKAIVVAARLAPPASPPASAPAPPQSALPLLTPSAAESTPAPSRPWRTVGWITGGIGLAGLALGAAFAAVTVSDRNAARCNAAGACANYDSVNAAKSAAPIAGAGLIGGGALVAAGAALLVFEGRW
jgi:hypothetical protein